MMPSRFCLLLFALLLPVSACRGQAASTSGTAPLASWRDRPARHAILSFVARVTSPGSPDFISPPERIAVFDNDGTLWPERPLHEGLFALARLQTMARHDPTLLQRQPYRAALEGDRAYLDRAGEQGILELLGATHGSMTQEQFADLARQFFESARHPKLGVPITDTAYVPMIELLDYLRSNGFQTWICGGGTSEFIRAVSSRMYGIEPEHVIGSTFVVDFIEKNGGWVLWRRPALVTFNDRHQKPISISQHIGRHPAFAAGNVGSGGDVAMLAWCQRRRGASLQLLITHDDPEREFVYREKDNVSLQAASRWGWTVVSMKNDWITVFAPPPPPETPPEPGA